MKMLLTVQQSAAEPVPVTEPKVILRNVALARLKDGAWMQEHRDRIGPETKVDCVDGVPADLCNSQTAI